MGVPVALHVRIDSVHAQPVDEQVGGCVVAFRDHQIQDLLKGHTGSVPPPLEDAGSSHHIVRSEGERFIPAQTAALDILIGFGQNEDFDHAGSRPGPVPPQAKRPARPVFSCSCASPPYRPLYSTLLFSSSQSKKKGTLLLQHPLAKHVRYGSMGPISISSIFPFSISKIRPTPGRPSAL